MPGLLQSMESQRIGHDLATEQHQCHQLDFRKLKLPQINHLHRKTVCFRENIHVSSVQSLSRVWLFVSPWITACQASLSITNSRSALRFTSIESVMPSSHLILCRPLLLLPSIPPSIRVHISGAWIHNDFIMLCPFRKENYVFYYSVYINYDLCLW